MALPPPLLPPAAPRSALGGILRSRCRLGNKIVYVSPDLESLGGERVGLASALHQNRFEMNEVVVLVVEAHAVRLLRSSGQPE